MSAGPHARNSPAYLTVNATFDSPASRPDLSRALTVSRAGGREIVPAEDGSAEKNESERDHFLDHGFLFLEPIME